MNRKALGKGINALIPDFEEGVPAGRKVPGTLELLIDEISPSKLQPRKYFDDEKFLEMEQSIRENGILQPVIVQKGEFGFELIAGERRWRAARKAGLKKIPAIIREVTDAQSLEIALIENIHRQDLNPIEEAKGYQRLINDFNYNQDKLSKFIGKSRSYIANSLRLLGLPAEVLVLVESGNLSAGHARSLIGLNNSVEIAKKIIQKKLSVRQSEALVRQFRDKKFKLVSRKDTNFLDLQKTLEEKTGLSVSINNKKNNSGNISFEYKDLEQLDKLINIIKDNY